MPCPLTTPGAAPRPDNFPHFRRKNAENPRFPAEIAQNRGEIHPKSRKLAGFPRRYPRHHHAWLYGRKENTGIPSFKRYLLHRCEYPYFPASALSSAVPAARRERSPHDRLVFRISRKKRAKIAQNNAKTGALRNNTEMRRFVAILRRNASKIAKITRFYPRRASAQTSTPRPLRPKRINMKV